MYNVKAVCLGLLLISAPTVFSQVTGFDFSSGPAISIGTRVFLQSDTLQEERELLISLPDSYPETNIRYPVVYVLDPEDFYQFQVTVSTVRALAAIERIPELIVVGIMTDDREGDLTPPSTTSGTSGGAVEFLGFIQNELQPFISQQYRTHPYEILIGHSWGGLFSIYAFLKHPDVFDAYIAISPSLWWEDGELVRQIKELPKEMAQFHNKTLYTSLADESGVTEESYEEFVEYVSSTPFQGLSFSNKSLPDESHVSTPTPSIYHGVLAVYEDWVPPDTLGSLEAIKTYYSRLSDRYGYELAPPEEALADVGWRLLSGGQPEAALEVFNFRAGKFPNSPMAYNDLGFWYRRNNDLDASLTAFEKCVELALEHGSEWLDEFLVYREEVAQLLNSNPSQ